MQYNVEGVLRDCREEVERRPGTSNVHALRDAPIDLKVLKNGVKLGEFTPLPVGAGNTFIAAMQQDKIQAGMTTEPTITRLLKTGEAAVFVGM
jgi:hypothetical protein